MKKTLIFCMLYIGIILTGCSNSEDENDMKKTYSEDTWEISAKASEDTQHKYQIMENYPTEGGPVITKKPNNAKVSELRRDAGIYYVYEPETGFTGTDEVEITTNISAGGSEIVAKNILTLKIVVNE
ncbi:hypothetical protein [Salinimicrobium marinum]|nr:hypothetical protein [Salinimicrobium marinum]